MRLDRVVVGRQFGLVPIVWLTTQGDGPWFERFVAETDRIWDASMPW